MKFSAAILSVTLAVGVVLCAFTTKAPAPAKPFEGTITYSIEYLKVPDEVVGMESMLPQETTMKFSDNKVKLVQEVMGGKQIVLVDNKAGDSHILMDMMGQKIDIYLTPEEVKKADKETPDPKIEELDGRKKILGYKCQEATITDAEGNAQTVFYTKGINIKHKDFNALDGFPLEYLTDQNGMKLRMTATNIKEEKIAASEFKVPAGYDRMSMDELQQMMGN